MSNGENASVATGEVSRRDFINEIGAAALGISGLGAAVVTVKYLSPNVLFEPPTSFRIGSPDDYPVNSVTYLPDQQVYIVRTVAGFLAVSAVCTHLGCITEWKQEQGLIACPCHGSKFQMNGSVVAGPAPKSLPHFAVRFTPDGSLLVDKLEITPITQYLKV